VWWFTPVIPHSRDVGRMIVVQGHPELHNETLSQKPNPKNGKISYKYIIQRWYSQSWGYNSVTEYLHDTLGSKPSSRKKIIIINLKNLSFCEVIHMQVTLI
jgi:hypothetical protein